MDKTVQKALGLQMNGFHSEALKIYQKALSKDPYNELLNEHYGSALATLGHYQDAKKYLKRALNNTIEKPHVLNNLGTVNRALGLYEEGLLNIKSALRFKPKFTDAWINRANLHADLQQWNDAINCYKNAINLNPQDRIPYISLANAYLHNQQYEAALESYKNSQKLFKDPQFLVGELICYRAMEDFDKAITFADKLKTQFDNELMWFEWVQTLWLAKDYQRFHLEINLAIEKFGKFPALMSLLELSKTEEE
jgi:tetratricopeptide (TPR) repeat protein